MILESIELVLDGLPPTNAADRRSPWAYHTLAKRWQNRTVAAVLDKLKRWPDKPLERAQVTITRCSSSEPDFDGLVASGKHLLDGLVKAGVLLDDKPSVIGQPTYLWERAPRGAGCVRIRVEALPVSSSHGVEIGPRIALQRASQESAE